MKPIFQCDKIDTISGFAEYGHVNGALFNLGNESGIVHHYIDTEVENGRTYYYALVAYDYGIADLRISPSENNVVIELDEDEEVRFFGQNVQIVTPHPKAAGYIPADIEMIDDDINYGIREIKPEILSEDIVKTDHVFKAKFEIDTVARVVSYDHGILYTTSGIAVYDVTRDDTLVYHENFDNQNSDNFLYNDTLFYAYLNPNRQVVTDVFDGLRLAIEQPFATAEYDRENSDWIQGSAPINIITTVSESYYFPWKYNIVFTDNPEFYTGRVTNVRPIRDETGRSRLTNLLPLQNFSFYVVNKMFTDSSGAFEKMDLVVQDLNGNNQFDYLDDRIFVKCAA